jgi:molybdenum cofactor cytidylyltransferase
VVTAAVILAAGAGRRLGGVAKALLTTADGTTFLERICSICEEVGADHRCVVVGEPHRAATAAEASRLGIEVVHNPDPSRGMSSSVALGFGHALACFDDESALLWPVDHALVRATTIEGLLAVAAADRIVIPGYAGRGGHPTLFGRGLWDELRRCDHEPDGARSVVRRDSERVERVTVEDPGVLADVDTPEDLAEIAQ